MSEDNQEINYFVKKGYNLNNWLTTKQSNAGFSSFFTNELAMKCEITTEVEEKIAYLIVTCRISPELIAKGLARMGTGATTKLLIETTQPRLTRMRRGEFGEAFSSGVMVELYSYSVPIQKLRYAITSDESLPGTDFIALKSSGNALTEVVFVESKLRTVVSSNAASDALAQLLHDTSKGIPDIIRFVSERLREQLSPLSDAFDDYMFDLKDTRNMETLCISLIFEDDVWRNKVLENLDEAIKETKASRVRVEIFRVRNLLGLVSKVFTGLGITEVIDDE